MSDRVAAIGDVHANARALEAVLAAIRRAGITRGACTGDLVLRGHEPERCVAALRGLGWPSVQGNTDRRVVERPPRSETHPAALRPGSRSWTGHRLSPESLAYLAGLPDIARITLQGKRVVVVHDGGAAIEEETPEHRLLAMAVRLDADCVVSGHTHSPVVRRVGDRLFVNPGSVGEGQAGDQRPSWAWVGCGPNGLVAGLERVSRPLARVRAPT